MQIILIILTDIPYAIFYIYSLIITKTIKDKDRSNKEMLASTIISRNRYVYTGVCIV